MSPLLTLLYVYLAMVVVVLLHEVGHLPKTIKVIRWFPIPEAASYSCLSRYGGLTMNLVLVYLIFITKPESFFLQWIGLFAWLHFIFYAVIGSVNNEPYVPKELMKYWVFDDIPNKYAIIFIPLGFFVLFYFNQYYIPILNQLVTSLI